MQLQQPDWIRTQEAGWRQAQLYLNTCTLFRGNMTPDPATGVYPEDVTITQVAANVPCLYTYTQNDDDPEPGLGRVKRRTALTEDEIHFEIGQDVRSQDWVYDTTLLADGSRSPNYGTVHRLESAGRKLPSLGFRSVNAQLFQAMEDEHAAQMLRGLGLIP